MWSSADNQVWSPLYQRDDEQDEHQSKRAKVTDEGPYWGFMNKLRDTMLQRGLTRDSKIFLLFSYVVDVLQEDLVIQRGDLKATILYKLLSGSPQDAKELVDMVFKLLQEHNDAEILKKVHVLLTQIQILHRALGVRFDFSASRLNRFDAKHRNMFFQVLLTPPLSFFFFFSLTSTLFYPSDLESDIGN